MPSSGILKSISNHPVQPFPGLSPPIWLPAWGKKCKMGVSHWVQTLEDFYKIQTQKYLKNDWKYLSWNLPISVWLCTVDPGTYRRSKKRYILKKGNGQEPRCDCTIIFSMCLKSYVKYTSLSA